MASSRRRARGESRSDQVLHDLVLAVYRDRATAGELAERDAMTLTLELQVNSAMHKAFAIHPIAHAHRPKQIDRTLLENART